MCRKNATCVVVVMMMMVLRNMSVLGVLMAHIIRRHVA